MGEPWARADTASFQQFSGPSARPSVARADSVYGGASATPPRICFNPTVMTIKPSGSKQVRFCFSSASAFEIEAGVWEVASCTIQEDAWVKCVAIFQLHLTPKWTFFAGGAPASAGRAPTGGARPGSAKAGGGSRTICIPYPTPSASQIQQVRGMWCSMPSANAAPLPPNFFLGEKVNRIVGDSARFSQSLQRAVCAKIHPYTYSSFAPHRGSDTQSQMPPCKKMPMVG